jgi:hypothetical protein
LYDPKFYRISKQYNYIRFINHGYGILGWACFDKEPVRLDIPAPLSGLGLLHYTNDIDGFAGCIKPYLNTLPYKNLISTENAHKNLMSTENAHKKVPQTKNEL